MRTGEGASSWWFKLVVALFGSLEPLSVSSTGPGGRSIASWLPVSVGVQRRRSWRAPTAAAATGCVTTMDDHRRSSPGVRASRLVGNRIRKVRRPIVRRKGYPSHISAGTSVMQLDGFRQNRPSAPQLLTRPTLSGGAIPDPNAINQGPVNRDGWPAPAGRSRSILMIGSPTGSDLGGR